MTAGLVSPRGAGLLPKRTQLQPLERRALALFAHLSPLSLKQISIALEVTPQHARTLVHGLESLGYVVRKPPVIHHNRLTRHVFRAVDRMQA